LLKGEELHLEELNNLAEVAGYFVVDSVFQLRRVDSSYQVGKGKAEELAVLVHELSADKIIFDNSLKPIQAYNLAKITGVETIDRFKLILEIFAKRVSTKEAKLQVQLATLQYQFPKLKESIRLAKMGEQPGFLGLGRYEIDVHLEAIKRQMSHIRKELSIIRRKRKLQRSRRLDYGFSSVSLAGYTYSGKTTLFNLLSSESKPVDDGLFTTLSTTTRAVDFQDRNILLTDTVGFVDRLPLSLIEAFHSTLEETVLSDVIILVVDFHESINDICRKLICCIDTLNKIGAYGIPIVTALNKIDMLKDEEISGKLTSLGDLTKNPIPISALRGTNIDLLKRKVTEFLEKHIQASFNLPFNDEGLSFTLNLHNQVNVINTRYEEDRLIVTLKAKPWVLEKLRGQIEKIGGKLLKINKYVE